MAFDVRLFVALSALIILTNLGEARLEILQDRLQATNHELSYRLRQAKACHEELYGRQRQAQRPRPLDADAAETHAATAALVRSCVEGQLLQAKAEKGLRSDRGCLVEGCAEGFGAVFDDFRGV